MPTKTSLTEVCFSPPPLQDRQVINAKHLLRVQKTYVFHESTRVTLSLSIPLAHCSQRTILQSHCDELSERRCDSSMGQGERASVEFPVAAGHLQDMIGLNNEMLEGDDKRFTRSTSLAVCFMTCFVSFPSEGSI